jgi:hypothetical protein
MDYTVIVGSIGVALLLLAFALNLFGVLTQENFVYVWMNILGGGISCYASYLINYMPFVILEGTWTIVALFGLGRIILQSKY